MYQLFCGFMITHKRYNILPENVCWVKWLKKGSSEGQNDLRGYNTEEHKIMYRTWDIDFKNLLEMYILVFLPN